MTIYNFNKAIKETSKEILGYRKKRKEERTKDATWTKIDERKLIKRKLLNATSPPPQGAFLHRVFEEGKRSEAELQT